MSRSPFGWQSFVKLLCDGKLVPVLSVDDPPTSAEMPSRGASVVEGSPRRTSAPPPTRRSQGCGAAREAAAMAAGRCPPQTTSRFTHVG
jgi:hypothetical protein